MKRIGNNDFLSLTEIADSLGASEEAVKSVLNENNIRYVIMENEGYVLEEEFLQMFRRNPYGTKVLEDRSMYPISEREILAETIKVLETRRKISIRELRECLKERMNLSEEDLILNPSRNDTKFDQKVRNLISHRDSNDLLQHCIYSHGFLYLREE